MGYLQNWAANLISAAVKLIPLGQTVGQQLLFNLNTSLLTAKEAIQLLEDRDLNSCSWGLALASTAHETQYSRLLSS